MILSLGFRFFSFIQRILRAKNNAGLIVFEYSCKPVSNFDNFDYEDDAGLPQWRLLPCPQTKNSMAYEKSVLAPFAALG